MRCWNSFSLSILFAGYRRWSSFASFIPAFHHFYFLVLSDDDAMKGRKNPLNDWWMIAPLLTIRWIIIFIPWWMRGMSISFSDWSCSRRKISIINPLISSRFRLPPTSLPIRMLLWRSTFIQSFTFLIHAKIIFQQTFFRSCNFRKERVLSINSTITDSVLNMRPWASSILPFRTSISS